MADDLKNRGPADRSRINVHEAWEVRWWCDQFGCTEVALRNAVRKAGPSAEDVQRELKAAGKQAFTNTGED